MVVGWRRALLSAIAGVGAVVGMSGVVAGAMDRPGVGQPGGGAIGQDALVFSLPNGQHLQMDFLWVDGDGSPAGAIAAIQQTVLGANPGAAVVQPQTAEGWVQAGYRWSARSARWQYNGAGRPAGMDSEVGAVIDAASGWNTAGSAFHFDYTGETGANTGACSGGGDGQNTVGWAPLEGSLLAVTCSLWTDDGSGMHTATEFDMQLDPAWDWSAGGDTKVDLESVVAHEFGHALGLAHTPNHEALMFADYTIGTIKQRPLPEDVGGLMALYGAPAAEPLVRNMRLRAGANLMTWPGDNTSLPGATAKSGVDTVYSYDPATQQWRHYFRNGPSYLNTLDILTKGQPYWFLAGSEGEIVVP